MKKSSRRITAVFFAALLTVSATTAGAAIDTSSPPTSIEESTISSSSLDSRLEAAEQLRDANLENKKNRKQKFQRKLNETFAVYVGKNRVNDSLFATDRQIATQIQNNAPKVAGKLADSDERLAQTSLDDAKMAHDRLSNDGNVSYDERQVERYISQAETALENGGEKPTARIQRYRRAWLNAQKALDIMDEAVDPRVQITTRSDPKHTNAITHHLNGTVTDVRPFELRNVTVRFADGSTKTTTVQWENNPFEGSQFNTTVTLTKSINNITVTAADNNNRLGTRESESSQNDDNKRNNAKNSDRGAQSDSAIAPSFGNDTLLLDADTLPDTYEESVVGTDPLNTDSDTPKTLSDESDDGIIDGVEDFDAEGVTTFVEYQVGTDPFDSDTDDDELTDYFEITYQNLNPTDNDTDDNGVIDGQDDNEPEGLINVREQAYETNPNVVDTDSDRLTDKYEADTTLTMPTISDSNSTRTATNESDDGTIDGKEDFENDTLTSALEQRIATDPFDPDTDDDRLTDAFEHQFETIEPTTNDTDADGTLDTFEDPDNETLLNVDEQSNGTVPTNPDTDDDFLTDAYEIRTATTDPVTADSDSTATANDEAGNRILDGNEDFDNEGLKNRIEQNISTNPFDRDTDGDRLTDLFEHRFDTVEPLTNDTDGDGLTDDQEDPDNESLINVREQRYGTLPLDPDTDTDNLTDKYEVDTTKTNPLVPDSDSSITDPNESRDSVIDGSEDFDDDNLSSAIEFAIGTDPFDPDTDDDGLHDGFEHRYDTIHPLENDTDGDGITDDQEDPDNETLVNIDEQIASTNPLDADTDDDRLTDAFEVRQSLTGPTDTDSDSTGTNTIEANNNVTDAAEDLDADGLSNLHEQYNATDPLVYDTDRDGLSDGFELESATTDPLNGDSDARVTATNESSDDVLDGAEDFDADNLTAFEEQALGTSPRTADSDDDTLRDAFEASVQMLDPTTVDSDADGIDDAADDIDGEGLPTGEEQTHGTSPALNDTDGDSLNDKTEINLGTNPLAADTDRDNLTDDEEYSLRTDPTAPDTDNDGLTDGVETDYETLDATVADTDRDGTTDGADDVDKDGLSNRREATIDTELAVNDTEGDGLLDGHELKLGTDPLVEDTDEDGLTDSSELEVGTDPLVADSDGDGTLDGAETYTTKVKNDESGVTISLTGEGDAAKQTTVEHKPKYHNDTVASAGPTVYVDSENESEIQETQVTVPVTTNYTDAEDLAVYVWNGSRKQAWHPVETKVDTKRGIATANVEGGAYVTVLNQTAWKDAISVEKKEPHEFDRDESVDCTGSCATFGDTISIGESASTSGDSGSVRIMCRVGPDGSCDEDEDGTLNSDDDCPSTEGYAGEGCPDSDDDGVHDGDDECKYEKEGANGENGCPVDDSDSDGVPDDEDNCDYSAGPEWNDGCPDEEESDRDGDGVNDDDDACPDTWGSKWNGCPDNDEDDDGTPDWNDPCPRDPYDRCNDTPENPDSDGDGVNDDEDNCPSTANGNQANHDGDADGDACDSDDDNDGYDDSTDNCQFRPNAEQQDRDGDGRGAACDPDEKDYDEASWRLDVPAGTGNVYFELEYRVDKASDEQTNLTFVGADGTKITSLQDTSDWTGRTIDLGAFAGETVTVRLSTTGDATISARNARVYQDTDADTLSDYREQQRWTIPYGYGDSFTLDAHSQDTDGDSLDDNEEVSLGPAPSNPASPLRVRYANSNPGEVDTDGDGLDDAKERQAETSAFLIDTDYDYLTDGEEVRDIGTDPLDRNTDNDALIDSAEGTVGVLVNGRRDTAYVSPLRADTDGDGLTDRQELGSQASIKLEKRYQLVSDPASADTDKDRLSDADEHAWGTDSFDSDTDNDNYNDYVDARPTVEDVPPDIQMHEASQHDIVVAVKDESGVVRENVQFNGWYTPKRGSPHWKTAEPHSYQPSPTYDLYYLEIPQTITIEGPEYYYLNISDNNENMVSFRIGQLSNDDRHIMGVKLSTAYSGVRRTRKVKTVGHTINLVHGAKALKGVGWGLIFDLVYQDLTTTYKEGNRVVGSKAYPTVPATSEQIVQLPSATQLPTTVRFPSGRTYEAPNPVGDGHNRQFGQEDVYRLPGVNSLNDVKEILRAPSAIEEYGEYTLVIGDNPNGLGTIGLWLIGNTLVSATAMPTDPQGHELEITDQVIDKLLYEKDDWDHNQLGNSRNEIRRNLEKIIRSPNEIYKEPGKDRWLYVKRMTLNGREVVVMLFTYEGVVRTAYVPTHPEIDGPSGHIFEWVKYHIMVQEMIKKYENEDEVPILPEIDVGEQTEKPDERPEP